MALYRIVQAPFPPSTDDVSRFKEMRLAALQVDQDMYRERYEDALKLTTEEWTSRLSSPHQALFSAANDMEWAGMALLLSPEQLRIMNYGPPPGVLSQEELEQEKEFWVLGSQWTRPSHRRSGIAKLLMDASSAYLRQRGKPVLLGLETKQANERGRAVYRAAGFEERFTMIYADEAPTVWMVKALE